MRAECMMFEKNKNLFVLLSSLAALAWIVLVYGHAIIVSSNSLFSTDFYKFYQSALFYFEGQNIYDKIIRPLTPAEVAFMHGTILILSSDLNPPFFILLLLPTAWLSYTQSFLVWSALSLIATFAGILLALKPYPKLWNNINLRLWALVGFLLYFPTYANLRFGQVTSFLLLITAGAWIACHKRKDRTAGILLGIALSIKAFYGLFFIFFLVRRQWRLLFYMCATYVVCAVSAFWVFGTTAYKNYYFILTKILWYSASWNASLLGFLTRMFGGDNEGNRPIFHIPNVTPILFLALFGLLTIYLIWTNWPKQNLKSLSTQVNTDLFDWGFSLTIVLMILLAPLGWVYYFPLLIIPYITILRISDNLSSFNINLTLLSLILLLSSMPGNYQRPESVIQTPMILTWASYYFYALVLLFALLVMLRQQILNKKYQATTYSLQHKFSPAIQLLLFVLAAIPSLITFGIAMS